jgi:hypothetical protein
MQKLKARKGCRTGKKNDMAVDYGTKAKTLETKGRYEPDGIPEALNTT